MIYIKKISFFRTKYGRRKLEVRAFRLVFLNINLSRSFVFNKTSAKIPRTSRVGRLSYMSRRVVRLGFFSRHVRIFNGT